MTTNEVSAEECNNDLGHPCDANDGEPCCECRAWRQPKMRLPVSKGMRDDREYLPGHSYRRVQALPGVGRPGCG